ncbi:lactonase [Kushneria avicenniae]|uniref:Lactonase n=1 Tax=Kushneria avicenniae TaxID=402385 RepID=A0A1I1GC61_9GAMM|nr:SMP-30/gluconolactonase/LRE family protein [Kushneria avicenniae]SFC06923.1 lactonase [Kushneria avicenniae]
MPTQHSFRPALGAMALGLILLTTGTAALAQSSGEAGAAQSPVPIPPAEQGLATRQAHQVVEVPDVTKDLEGPVFTDDGRLIFSDTQGGRLLSWTPDKGLSTLATLDGLMPGGMAVHDGRLFVAAFTTDGGGAIVSMALDGSDQQSVVPEEAGFLPNDVVFDDKGGFYFTDSHSDASDPKGGAYYHSPEGDISPVIEHLDVGNGIALSPQGDRLWVGEFGTNQLHRLDLADATSVAPFGGTVAYYFIGPAPDSMRVDAEGHVYVAMYGQGKIMVFSREGLPIGQILLPGRNESRFLHVTSMAIRPGTDELTIVATDGKREPGEAALFQARAFGKALNSR